MIKSSNKIGDSGYYKGQVVASHVANDIKDNILAIHSTSTSEFDIKDHLLDSNL